MLKAVADTNVMISAVIADGKPRQFLRRCIAGEWQLVTSSDLVAEFVEVLQRPKFGLAQDEVYRALAALVEAVTMVEPRSSVNVIVADPDDNAVLEAAPEGKVDFIVSGDRHLLSLGRFDGIPIVTVAQFLEAQRKS